MRESAKSAPRNSLKLTIQCRSLRATGESHKIKQLDESLTAFFFYIFAITAQFHIFCKPRCKPVNQMNKTIKVLCYKPKTLSNGEHRRIIKYLCLGVKIVKSENEKFSVVYAMQFGFESFNL